MELKCKWPAGTETLRVGMGYKNCAGRPSLRVGMATGSIVLSTHLHAEDAVTVAQALAVERSKLLPMGAADEASYPCTFFGGVSVAVAVNAHDTGDDVSFRVGGGLAYLSKGDAKALAMDLLEMTADEA